MWGEGGGANSFKYTQLMVNAHSKVQSDAGGTCGYKVMIRCLLLVFCRNLALLLGCEAMGIHIHFLSLSVVRYTVLVQIGYAISL